MLAACAAESGAVPVPAASGFGASGLGASGSGAADGWAGGSAAGCSAPDRGQPDKLLAASAGATAAAAPAAKGNALARSVRLTFMPLSVDSVIFCTCNACTVALSARLFCSSQNCTALSSSMRLSISSTLMVGATQCEKEGMAAGGCPALLRFCRKSKPGINFPKPKADESLIPTSCSKPDKKARAPRCPGCL